MVSLDTEGLCTPEDVLSFAGEMLVKAGKVSKAYVQEIIETYRTLGAYFLMAPGIALPHARPSDAVYESAISFVRLKTPVEFGHPENDPVKLVFLLAGSAGCGHMDMIGELGRLLSDENSLKQLYLIKTYEEFKSLLEDPKLKEGV